jgi:arylsulfatase A-like enzyme
MALGLAGCGGDDSSPEPARADAPNVILVLTDDQDAASLQQMPYVGGHFAAGAHAFREAFVTTPECCPSRASFLTGEYAHNHGVLSNDPKDGGFNSFQDDSDLPVWLHDAGYRTGFVGKYLNGYGWTALDNDPGYVPLGWDSWAALTNHTEYQLYDYDLNVGGDIEHYGSGPADYQTTVLGGKAERFISAGPKQKPFFLFLAPSAPHDEGVLEGKEAARNPRPAPQDEGAFGDAALPRPPSFNEADVNDKPRFVRREPLLRKAQIDRLQTLYRSRLESLLAVDRMVKGLVAELRQSGELDNTVIFFASDNGYLLGEHRLEGKDRVYEESVRIPLLVHGAGFSPGVDSKHLVANIDFAPTVLDLAGLKQPETVDGESLRRIDDDWRRSLLLEVPQDRGFAAVRTADRLFADYFDGGTELYDLKRDPAELENVRKDADYAKVIERLDPILGSLEKCAGEECRRAGRAG